MSAGDVTGSVVTSVAMNDDETTVTNESVQSIHVIHVIHDFHDVHDGVAEAVSVCGGEGPVGGVVPGPASRLP